MKLMDLAKRPQPDARLVYLNPDGSVKSAASTGSKIGVTALRKEIRARRMAWADYDGHLIA